MRHHAPDIEIRFHALARRFSHALPLGIERADRIGRRLWVSVWHKESVQKLAALVPSGASGEVSWRSCARREVEAAGCPRYARAKELSMTRLRQRMIEDMQVRNFAKNTQASYLLQVSAFARHFGKSPDVLTFQHVRDYQLHLVREKKLAASSITVAVSALRFLYKCTLHKDWNFDDVLSSPRQKITERFRASTTATSKSKSLSTIRKPTRSHSQQ